MRGELRQEQINLTIQSIIAYGIERPELRDEIFCQVIRQSTDCPRDDWLLRTWQFMSLCIVAYPPSRHLNKYLLAFFSRTQNQPITGRYSQWCYNVMRITKASPRKLPPSSIEINVSCNWNWNYNIVLFNLTPVLARERTQSADSQVLFLGRKSQSDRSRSVLHRGRCCAGTGGED